jgi:hypothetical protein
MTANTHPCLLTDEKEQLHFSMEYLMSNQFDSKSSLVKNCTCGCGQAILGYASFYNADDLTYALADKLHVRLFIRGKEKPLKKWLLLMRTQDDIHCLAGTEKHQEVIKLNSDSVEFPLCSILTSKGVFHTINHWRQPTKMKTNNIPCILKDLKLQLELATRYTKPLLSPSKQTTKIVRQCLCGCNKTIVCSLLLGKVTELILFVEPYRIINRWRFTKQDIDVQPPTQHIVYFLLEDDDDPVQLILKEEVIKVDNIETSPLCSILCSDKIIHNVLDLDWNGFSEATNKNE